jgi:hypothetical protein
MCSRLLRFYLSQAGAPQHMHVATSYDFGGSSEVKLHVVTDDLDLAQDVYASVLTVNGLEG